MYYLTSSYRIATPEERKIICKLFFMVLKFLEYYEFLEVQINDKLVKNYQGGFEHANAINHFKNLSNNERYGAWQQLFLALMIEDKEIEQNGLFESSFYGLFAILLESIELECDEQEEYDRYHTESRQLAIEASIILKLEEKHKECFNESYYCDLESWGDQEFDDEEFAKKAEIAYQSDNYYPKSEYDTDLDQWQNLIESIYDHFDQDRDFEIAYDESPQKDVGQNLALLKIMKMIPSYHMSGAAKSFLALRKQSLSLLTQALMYCLFTDNPLTNSTMEELVKIPLTPLKNTINKVNEDTPNYFVKRKISIFSKELVISYFRIIQYDKIKQSDGLSWNQRNVDWYISTEIENGYNILPKFSITYCADLSLSSETEK